IHSLPGEIHPIHGSHSLSSRLDSPHPGSHSLVLQVRFTPSMDRIHSPPGEIHPIRDRIHLYVDPIHAIAGVHECDPAADETDPGTRGRVSPVDRRVPQASLSDSRADGTANATDVSPRGATGRVAEVNQSGRPTARTSASRRPRTPQAPPRHGRTQDPPVGAAESPRPTSLPAGQCVQYLLLIAPYPSGQIDQPDRLRHRQRRIVAERLLDHRLLPGPHRRPDQLRPRHALPEGGRTVTIAPSSISKRSLTSKGKTAPRVPTPTPARTTNPAMRASRSSGHALRFAPW
ncbi:MAG: hypothetical protein JWN02_1837, partial [Acidobacteria bacterium]|nr:hypothetical protein [Acidobacteriota bacterium]